jgi:hypothetical protein
MEGNNKRKLLVLINILGLAAALVMNVLANALPLNGKNTGEISDSIPDLFAPAGITFAIWGVIYMLLIVFAGYQVYLLRKKPDNVDSVSLIGIWFFISSIANALWIVAWHWERQILSLLLILTMLASLMIMFTRIKSVQKKTKPGFSIAVEIPISIYFGWITVASIANLTTVLVVYEWNRFGLSEQFWTAAVIGAAVIINLLVLFREHDIWFPLVGFWALLGITVKRTMEGVEPAQAVVFAAIAGMVILGVSIVLKTAIKIRYGLTAAN